MTGFRQSGKNGGASPNAANFKFMHAAQTRSTNKFSSSSPPPHS